MVMDYKSNVMISGSKLPNTNYNTNTFFCHICDLKKKKKTITTIMLEGKCHKTNK